MAKARFDWSALPGGLLRQLKGDLGIRSADVGQALARRFGAQPDERFIQEAWPAIRDRWVAKDPAVRRSVVAELRGRGLGKMGPRGSSAREEVAFLRICRNSPGLRAVVLAHLLALGKHVAPMESKPSPHAARRDAWEEFANALATNLAELEVDQYLVLSTRHRPAHFVRLDQLGPSGIRAETSSNALLEEWEQLDDLAQAHLEELGWLAPTPATSDGAEVEESPNYFQDWPLPVPYPRVAAVAIRTLHEVLEIPHPGFLTYSAHAPGGVPILLPNLGIVRAADKMGMPAPLPSQGDLPSSPDELLARVKTVVRSVLGVDEVQIDEDGDIPIRSEVSLTYVRVFKDEPVVRVFSPVLWDFGVPTDIEETVNGINKSTRWVKAIWDNGAVVLFSDVVGAPLAVPQLQAAITSVLGRSDEFGPELQKKYGGRTAFGSPLPPRQGLLGGYL